MDLLNIAGGLGSGYQAGQEMLLRRRILEQQLAQQQAQTQGQGAAADALAALMKQRQTPQIGMPPAPGQQSMPQQPPQQPMPQEMPRPAPQFRGPMPGQMPPPPGAGMGGAPAGGGPGAGPQPLKPYSEPRPPTPQMPQPMAGIGAPPQQRPSLIDSQLPDLQEMADTLTKQGIKGPALFYALQQHQGFLNQDGKRQLAELTLQYKSALQEQGNEIKRMQQERLQRESEGQTASGASKIKLREAQAENQQARADKIREGISAASKGGKSGDGATLSDEDARFLGEMRAKGDTSALTGLGYGKVGAANRAKVTKYWREAAGGDGADAATTDAEYFGSRNAQRTVAGRAANVALAVSEAKKFADLALQASGSVPRTEYPSINKMAIAAQKGTGSPEVAKFMAAHNSLINAYARAVSPSGTPTVSDKEHAREILDTAYSEGQYKAAVEQLQAEMAAAQEAPREVKKQLREDAEGPKKPPKAGAVVKGYRFKGGDPSKPESWEKV